jgi:hypothetical protein
VDYSVVHVITAEAYNELQNEEPTIFPDPSVVQSTSIGQNFTVNINVTDVYNLGGWSTGVVFNSSVLKCTGFYEGDFLNSSGQYTFFGPSTFADPNNPSESTPYARDDIVGIAGTTGSGLLTYLTFTSVGIGVSNIQLIGTSLLSGGIMSGAQPFIPFEIDESFAVPFNGTMIGQVTTHQMEASNATAPSELSNPTFNPQNKEISFSIMAATKGYLQVGVPMNLLKCNTTSQWAVKVDGTSIPYTATETATTTELSFQHDQGNHTVEIIGTDVLGESLQNPPPAQGPAPPSLLVLIAASVCIATLLVALVDLKKTRTFRALKEITHTPLKYIQQTAMKNPEQLPTANTH